MLSFPKNVKPYKDTYYDLDLLVKTCFIKSSQTIQLKILKPTLKS